MRKGMLKRATAVFLSAAMIFTGVNGYTTTVKADSTESDDSTASYKEILTGERSTRLSMESNSAVVTVEVITADGYFRTSVVDGNSSKYITTTSNGQGWYSAGAEGKEIYWNSGTAGTGVIQGHIYEVRYTRNDSSYTIEYYDVSAGASLYTYYSNNTNLTDDVIQVYVKAESGTYRVYNCSAEEAGFSKGSYSENVQLSHGVNRNRYVGTPDNTVPEGYDVNTATQGSAKKGKYNDYFLKDLLQEVRINIAEDNLDYVLQNSGSKESALAKSVTIGNATVENVGLKTKGNFTRNQTTSSTSDRFSFTVNFGKYVKKKYGYSETQNFFGCSKISFNNFYFDKTMMKEYNAYRLMTEMGLPTPQYGLAKLYINGEYYGVYFMIEAMDSSILEQYYDTSSKNLSSYLAKPSYYSPRYYSQDFEGCISDGVVTWDALVADGQIIQNSDGTYSWGSKIGYYSGLWNGDSDTFQDVVQDLPEVFTWIYRLTMLSDGKDFNGNSIDVNSDKYLELLGQIMDVDETVKYFAAHSFVVQMDNLFTWRQNYGLYVSKEGKSLMVPWDYDLSWGCDGEPADAESVANWDVDKLYNSVASAYNYYSDDLADYYAGTSSHPYNDKYLGTGSGFPLFNVIYQNKTLMKKFHEYVEDCSKITTLGGTTTEGKTYTAGRFGETIDNLYNEIVEAASEPLAANVYYLQYNQPTDVKSGLKALKKIIALRSVGAWLQVNNIDATVTGYGYETGSLGNDATSAKYTTSGENIAVVDDTTGIFTIADYAESQDGPELSVEKMSEDSTSYKNVDALVKKNLTDEQYKLKLYSLSSSKEAVAGYQVFLPAESTKAKIYAYSEKTNKLEPLETTEYDNHTYAVQVSSLSYLAVVEDSYNVGFSTDEGVDSIDVYYKQANETADETGVTTAYARNSDTGEIDVSGDGQINFKVNLKEGYEVKSVTADKNYKNVKTPTDTKKDGVYRVTKITGDVNITIVTKKSSEGSEESPSAEEESKKFTAEFSTDEGVESIDVYYTQSNETADETGVTTAYARNSDTGKIDVSGDGQINFKINLKEGYEVESVTADTNYKNLKTPTDTKRDGVYRVTKITGDVTIRVVTKKISSEEENDSNGGEDASGNGSNSGNDNTGAGNSGTGGSGNTSNGSDDTGVGDSGNGSSGTSGDNGTSGSSGTVGTGAGSSGTAGTNNATANTTTGDSNVSSETETKTKVKGSITVKKGKKKVSSVKIKKKKKVTLTVSVSPSSLKVKLKALTTKQKKVVKASLKGKKLTIRGKKKGTVTLVLKAGSVTKKIKVKIS